MCETAVTEVKTWSCQRRAPLSLVPLSVETRVAKFNGTEGSASILGQNPKSSISVPRNIRTEYLTVSCT